MSPANTEIQPNKVASRAGVQEASGPEPTRSAGRGPAKTSTTAQPVGTKATTSPAKEVLRGKPASCVSIHLPMIQAYHRTDFYLAWSCRLRSLCRHRCHVSSRVECAVAFWFSISFSSYRSKLVLWLKVIFKISSSSPAVRTIRG